MISSVDYWQGAAGAERDVEMTKIEWVRDGKQQILGSKTICTSTGITVARDRSGKILGHSNDKAHITRDSHGRLVRSGEADADCFFGR